MQQFQLKQRQCLIILPTFNNATARATNNRYHVNVVNLAWLCQTKYIIVAFQRLRVIFELLPAEICLFQMQLLYHCAHSTIEYHDSLL